jgi:O-Antigen ligase
MRCPSAVERCARVTGLRVAVTRRALRDEKPASIKLKGHVRFAPVVERALTAAVPATAVAALAWSSGGYFPRTWGAVLIVEAIAVAAVSIMATRLELGWSEVVIVGALVALMLWQLLSRAWAVDPDATVLEAERTLLYAGAAAVAFLAVPSRRSSALVTGVLLGAGVATVGGLLEHVLADAPSDRLDAPIGYANAAGILATTTLLLGLGYAAEGPFARRALGAALCPPAAAALYISLSRGSVVVAALGVLVLTLTIRSGAALGRLVLTALPTLAAVAVVAVDELDAPGRSAGELASLLALVASSAGALALVATTPRLPTLGISRRTAFSVVGVAAVLAVVALGYVGVRQVRERASAPPAVQQHQVEGRLFSTSTSFRSDYWDVAGGMVGDAVWIGDGAGGFTRTWLRERPALLYVRDAHSLYLETMAELGLVGLAAVLVVLLTPLLAARRATSNPVARAALAAYVALVAHAAIDWDWELPAVTLCTLLLGVALVRSAGGERSLPASAAVRSSLAVGAVALGLVAVGTHVGNGATAEAHDALDRGDADAARREALRARRFLPWSAEPWQLLGEAELAAGRIEPGRGHLRRATSEDPGSWSAWLSLALATRGAERERALERARALNPLEPEVDAAKRVVQNP